MVKLSKNKMNYNLALQKPLNILRRPLALLVVLAALMVPACDTRANARKAKQAQQIAMEEKHRQRMAEEKRQEQLYLEESKTEMMDSLEMHNALLQGAIKMDLLVRQFKQERIVHDSTPKPAERIVGKPLLVFSFSLNSRKEDFARLWTEAKKLSESAHSLLSIPRKN